MSHFESIEVSPSHTSIAQVIRSQSVQQVTTSHTRMQVIMTHEMSSHIAWVTMQVTTKKGYRQCTSTPCLRLGSDLHACFQPIGVGQYNVRPVSHCILTWTLGCEVKSSLSIFKCWTDAACFSWVDVSNALFSAVAKGIRKTASMWKDTSLVCN